MAIGKVTFIRKDGNLTKPALGSDHISGLLFDVSGEVKLPSGIAKGDVVQIFSLNEAELLGILPFDAEGSNILSGIPHFHIQEFFRIKPDGSLYISFADCSKNWNAIETMQSIAQGNIRQLGVWTTQLLWNSQVVQEGEEGKPYTVNMIADLNGKAEVLAKGHQPVSILLCANCTTADKTEIDKAINLSLIPTCIGDYPRVSVLIGQGRSELIKKMQMSHPKHASIGCVGTALGCVANAKVSESIAWVNQFNLAGSNLDAVEMGYGNMALVEDKNEFTSTLPFESLSEAQLDELDGKGYIFPIKYAGRANGTYFSKDQTCSSGDYRTIARNRTIDKSRRAIRNALLTYLNAPVLVNPKTGYLSETEIKKYKNVIKNVLDVMENNGEIAGSSINIPTNQNVLLTDSLKIVYALVPVGVSTQIIVEEGLALTSN